MATPEEVFKLIERADERIKYAQNRGDAAEAYRQARDSLGEATTALAGVEDARARAGLKAQISKRLEDLERIEKEGA